MQGQGSVSSLNDAVALVTAWVSLCGFSAAGYGSNHQVRGDCGPRFLKQCCTIYFAAALALRISSKDALPCCESAS